MTVSAQTTYNTYTGNGVTTVFPYQFKILAGGDLAVYVDNVLKALGVDYTVSGVGADVGGSVTFISGAPAASAEVSIIREMDVARSTDYQQQGDFNAGTVNPDFDNPVLLIQDVQTQLNRSIRTPAGEVGTIPALPSKTARAGKYIAFDAAGQPQPSAGTGTDNALRTDLASGVAGSDGARLSSYRRTEAGSVARTVFEILTEHASLRDFMGAPDGVSDNKAAIQNWLSCGAKKLYIPGNANAYMTSGPLNVKVRTRIFGDGPRQSRIRHTAGAVVAGGLLALEVGAVPSGGVNDITEGGYVFENFGIETRNTANAVGVFCASNVHASMFRTQNFRNMNQIQETLGAAPYAVPAGSRGFDFGDGSGGIFNGSHSNIEVRSYETAVYCNGGINDQFWHGWFVDCKFGFDLNGVSGILSHLKHESNVLAPRNWVIRGVTSHVDATAERWELPQAGRKAVEFINATGSNLRFRVPIRLLADGGAWPGDVFVVTAGSAPADCLFEMAASDGNPMIQAPLSTAALRVGPTLWIGGNGKGDGKLLMGRDLDDASLFIIQRSANNHFITAANSLRLCGDGTTTYKVDVNSTGVAFQGTNAIAKPTITGAKGGNAAVASIATQGAAYGLWVDGTT